MARYQATIPDLTFTRNQAHTIIQGWEADQDGGGDSDHALITTLLGIKPLSFAPKMQHHCTDWEIFRRTVTTPHPGCHNYTAKTGTLKAASDICSLLSKAIKLSVP